MGAISAATPPQHFHTVMCGTKEEGLYICRYSSPRGGRGAGEQC